MLANHEFLRENIKEAQERQKKYYDQHHLQLPIYRVGDYVYLNVGKQIKTTQPCQKLAAKRHGPFKIIEVLPKDVYRLELPDTMALHPVFNATRLEPAHNDPLPGQIQPPPPPVEIDGEPEWEVEAILDSAWKDRGKNRQVKYFVRWAGYPHWPDDWRTLKELTNCSDILEDFHQRHPRKPRHPDLIAS